MNKPSIQDEQVRDELLHLALMVCLYEKQTSTELAVSFVALIQERHENFHDTKVPWTECKNEKCTHAQRLFEDSQKPEVVIGTIAWDAFKPYGIAFRNFGTSVVVRLVSPGEAKAQERELAEQVPPEQQPQPQVVLTDS